jgi:predicted dehydrogenase
VQCVEEGLEKGKLPRGRRNAPRAPLDLPYFAEVFCINKPIVSSQFMGVASLNTDPPGLAKALEENRAPSLNVIGANDRINVGVVGAGWGGLLHLTGIKEMGKKNNATVAAVADLSELRRAWACQRAELPQTNAYSDHRAMLERKDLDAIVVATHDHLHAQVSLDCLDAGKHVYCEKPMTRYLDEAFRVADKVKSSRKVFQLNVSYCSSEAWLRCAEFVRAGTIGQVVWGEGSYTRNGGPSCDGWRVIKKEDQLGETQWKTWLGALKWRPFDTVQFHQWRLYEEFSAGLLASQAAFALYPLMLGTGTPQFPTRVTCLSGRNLQHDLSSYKPTITTNLPRHIQFIAEFPDGHSLAITTSWLTGDVPKTMLFGHKASLVVSPGADRIEITPEKALASDTETQIIGGLKPEYDARAHEQNWFDCIRSGAEPNAGISISLRAQTVLALAEMSDRLSITCLFDERTRKITDANGNEIAPLNYGSLDI